MTYLRHALSAAWGDMPADEFQALVDDIEANGQRDPITIFDGAVLDGWHRYQACERLMLNVKASVLPDDEDAVAWVISKNAKRRSLNASQRAMAVAECQQWAPVGANQHSTGGSAPGAHPATSLQMAEQAGVSPRTVKQAKAVITSASPEVKAAVKAGTVSVKKAAAVSSLPQEKQAAALAEKPAKKPKRELPQAPAAEYEVDNLRATMHALSEQNEHLEARLAVEAMDASEDEKTAAAALIRELQSQVKTLEAEADSLRSMRDSLLVENGSLKRQCESLVRRLKKLEQPA